MGIISLHKVPTLKFTVFICCIFVWFNLLYLICCICLNLLYWLCFVGIYFTLFDLVYLFVWFNLLYLFAVFICCIYLFDLFVWFICCIYLFDLIYCIYLLYLFVWFNLLYLIFRVKEKELRSFVNAAFGAVGTFIHVVRHFFFIIDNKTITHTSNFGDFSSIYTQPRRRRRR